MNRLRWTFIGIASGAVLVMLTIVLFSLYSVSTVSNYNEIYSITQILIDNGGKWPSTPADNSDNDKKDSEKKGDDKRGKENKETPTDFNVYEEMPYELRYFALLTDKDGDIIIGNYERISTVKTEDADKLMDSIMQATSKPMLTRIFNDPKQKGIIFSPDSDFAYMRKQLTPTQMEKALTTSMYYADSKIAAEKLEKEGGYIIVFFDCTRRILNMRDLRVSMLRIGAISFLVFFLIIMTFSKRAIQPYIENHEKQREFITNAGHELKTPLTIISANMEVLEMIEGKNEWTESTLNQVKRLTGLVNDFITMARSDDYSDDNIKMGDTIDVSKIVKDTAESFRPVAEKQFKRIEMDISESVTFTGDQKTFSELVSILIDNAVKYCDDRGVIKVALYSRKRGFQYIVSNDFADGAKADYSRFFERFYRGDTSHNSEKAGYGIGLSMAETIVKRHRGKITVNWTNGVITFAVIM